MRPADFERLVSLLLLEDQQELFQLLVREVAVSPSDPEREVPEEAPVAAMAKRAGGRAVTAKIRTR